MEGESAESAMPVVPDLDDLLGTETPAPKKRGPKSRREIEAEIRADVEAEVRAEIAAEAEKKASEEAAVRSEAEAVRPLPADQVGDDPLAEGSVTIHFVDDGFTTLGRVWLRGEHLTIKPGTPNWDATMTRGKPLVELDEYEQEEIWGRRFFRQGVWRGQRWDEVELPPLGPNDDPSTLEKERAVLRKAQEDFEKKYGLTPG